MQIYQEQTELLEDEHYWDSVWNNKDEKRVIEGRSQGGREPEEFVVCPISNKLAYFWCGRSIVWGGGAGIPPLAEVISSPLCTAEVNEPSWS